MSRHQRCAGADAPSSGSASTTETSSTIGSALDSPSSDIASSTGILGQGVSPGACGGAAPTAVPASLHRPAFWLQPSPADGSQGLTREPHSTCRPVQLLLPFALSERPKHGQDKPSKPPLTSCACV